MALARPSFPRFLPLASCTPSRSLRFSEIGKHRFLQGLFRCRFLRLLRRLRRLLRLRLCLLRFLRTPRPPPRHATCTTSSTARPPLTSRSAAPVPVAPVPAAAPATFTDTAAAPNRNRGGVAAFATAHAASKERGHVEHGTYHAGPLCFGGADVPRRCRRGR